MPKFMKLLLPIVCFILLLSSCTNNNNVEIKNERQGQLKASVVLKINGEKIFALDDSTAPKPEYTQIFLDSDKRRHFTFLNSYTNSIYFYDYTTTKYVKKITWNKTDQRGVSEIKAYHIKSIDSIYIFKKHPHEIILSNAQGNILHRTSLMLNPSDKSCFFKYPQYFPSTTIPFIETKNELLLNGFYFGIIPDSIISTFKFTACLNFKTQHLRFSNTYPRSLYGHNYNWYSDMLTWVSSDLHSDGEKLVLSFPISHDLYIADLNTGQYKRVYGGSNFAGTIYSVKSKKKIPTDEEIMYNFMTNDNYTAIKYDPFRKVYYRFLLKAIATPVKNQDFKTKPVDIIVMDENFTYLGETTIGTWKNWNWQNSFVTKEGLNIEYNGNDPEEKNIILKIFTIKKLK
jgi:hypothetical protein